MLISNADQNSPGKEQVEVFVVEGEETRQEKCESDKPENNGDQKL